MIGVAHLVKTRHGAFVEARAGRRIAYGASFVDAVIAAILSHLGGASRVWGKA